MTPVLITGRTQRRPWFTHLPECNPRKISPSPDWFSTGPEGSPWPSGLFFFGRVNLCLSFRCPDFVIPAKAGIHLHSLLIFGAPDETRLTSL